MSGRYREFCRGTPWQGPCDLCRTRSPRDLALGLPVVYEHCTYISRLARCALSKIGLAGDVEGSYGLLLPLLICLYVLTYFRPVPRLFLHITPLCCWRWKRVLYSNGDGDAPFLHSH